MNIRRTSFLPVRGLMVLALVLGVAFPTVVTTAACRAARRSAIPACCRCGMMSGRMMMAMGSGLCPARAGNHGKNRPRATCTVVHGRELTPATAGTPVTPCPVQLDHVRQPPLMAMILHFTTSHCHGTNPDGGGFGLSPLRGKCVLII